MNTPLRHGWFCLLLLLFLISTGCAVNPVTGQQQIMLLSELDELRLGEETDKSVVKQYGMYEDAKIQAYLQRMGLDMARQSHRPNLNWQFKVMDSPVVNAFAAPGGYIYVTRGLLAAVNNEAELAGVLGHEIGHVTARHSAQQYSKMQLANLGKLGLSLGQDALGGYGDVLGKGLETFSGLLFLKFSRDDERQADAISVEYAAGAGYDPTRISDFFVTLQRQPSADNQAQARLPEFFSTHPNPVNREATVRSLADNKRAQTPGQLLKVNRQPFLRQIDGLVYGEDPRKGYRDGDWYYWPQYQVKLPIPGNWKLVREGDGLQMSHPKKKAVALFNARPDSRIGEVVAEFLKASGAIVQSDRSATYNGIPVRIIFSAIGSGQQRALIVSHFYQQGPNVYVFHGLTGEAEYATMYDVMQRPATGFTAMKDRAKLNRQPQRIVVKKVSRSATMEKTLRSMKINQNLWAKVAWLNGRQLTDLLPAGEEIKVIE